MDRVFGGVITAQHTTQQFCNTAFSFVILLLVRVFRINNFVKVICSALHGLGDYRTLTLRFHCIFCNDISYVINDGETRKEK